MLCWSCWLFFIALFHCWLLFISLHFLNSKTFFKRIIFRTNGFITIQNWPRKHFHILIFSHPAHKYTPSSKRLNTGKKSIITSSVTKDVYLRPSGTICEYIQLKSGLSTLVVRHAVFWIKIDGWKDFMLQNDKFPSFGYLGIYSNISKITLDSNNTF